MPPSTLLRLPLSRSIHAHLLPRRAPHPSTVSPLRYASSSSPGTKQNKNPQHSAQLDREKMNTDANEYAKSGTDDTAAQNDEAAFDPNITDPEHARKKAGEGNDVNPLDASPANPELSKGTSEVDKSKEN